MTSKLSCSMADRDHRRAHLGRSAHPKASRPLDQKQRGRIGAAVGLAARRLSRGLVATAWYACCDVDVPQVEASADAGLAEAVGQALPGPPVFAFFAQVD